MAKPKLALIPAAQGSKFYSVLPSSGVGDFTFSRSGSATRINSQGLIETVGNGVSRLNYPMIDGKVVGCPHHILEPQRSNLYTYSEDFTQDWTFGGAGAFTITPNAVVSPNGTQNASKLIASSVGHQLRQNKAIINTQMSNSFYMRTNQGTRQMSIRINDNEITQNFTVTSEWKRYTVSGLVGGTLNGSGRCSLNNIDILDENNHVYIWGAQVEQGSYPTSYIPTNGSAVTRSTETANGSGDAATFNDSEGVLMAEISALAKDSAFELISISGTDSYISFGFSNNTTSLYIDSKINNIQLFPTANTPINQTENNKIAVKYKSGNPKLYVNGFNIISTTVSYAVGSSSLNNLKFKYQNDAFPFYGNTKQIQYYDSALTDSELETLTSWVSFSDMANGQLYTIE